MTLQPNAATFADDEDVPTLGMAAIVRMAYEGRDLAALGRALQEQLAAEPTNAVALMDLSTLLQVTSQPEQARAVQSAALALRRCYHRPHGQASGPRILAFVAPGDFMANTPIDFLLEGTDLDLRLYYIDADTQDLSDAPAHDVAFLAIGESAENLPILERAGVLLEGWSKPVINGAWEAIASLSRDGVSDRLADDTTVLAPPVTRAVREVLSRVATGAVPLSMIAPKAAFPIIVRPIGTHAGKGLEKIDAPEALIAYLDRWAEAQFYIAPFIDYASPDGLFRKQRIAFIDGVAYPSHFAASEHWMVHYLSARMTEEADRRAEEAAWMVNFDTDFAVRHARAFEILNRRLGLDYYGIDCAELADGRLLLFEADVAMLVHDLDPASMFPYKKPAMRRLFDAFAEALKIRVK